jgi:hypothetical protein
MEQLLRTQMQARYGPERLGHFGLSLATYAHFTSPIRRYADLLVHRALVRAYKLGEGGLPPEDAEKFEEIGEQISRLERRAMQAERETLDRYVAAYLADQVGQLVDCRITGVQPFGFFATVSGSAATAWFRPRPWDPNISATTRSRSSSSASRAARPIARGRSSSFGSSRPIRCRGASVRTARGQLWRCEAVRPPRSHARRPAAGPPGEHPPQQPPPLTHRATIALRRH